MLSFPCENGPWFLVVMMRFMLDGHNLKVRDAMFALMASSDLFVSKRVGDQVFVSSDFNQWRNRENYAVNSFFIQQRDLQGLADEAMIV
jgi:hypothetical protein